MFHLVGMVNLPFEELLSRLERERREEKGKKERERESDRERKRGERRRV